MIWIIISMVLAIVAIYDIAKSMRDTMTKVVLIILVLSFPIIGPVIYMLVFREKDV